MNIPNDMNNDTLIISFYTDDWEYPNHAEQLKSTCNELGFENYIIEKPSTKNYIKNTAIKPFFIKECLEKFKRPVTWIDVDALILKKFTLDISDVDMLACEQHDRKWSVSFLSINYTPAALNFLTEWCNETQSKLPGKTDEAALERAWQSQKNNINIRPLPETFNFVKWSGKLTIPEDTIICIQLSTWEDKLKRKINGRLIEEI